MTRATYQRDRPGNSRRERAIQKGYMKNARRREKGVYKIWCESNIVKKVAKKKGFSMTDLSVYGIYKEKRKWIVTAMAFYRSWNSSKKRNRRQVSSMEKGDYCVITSDNPKDGIPIFEKATKKEALKEIGAKSSEKVKSGMYVIRTKHKPNFTTEEVPKKDFQKAKRKSYICSSS